MKQRIENLIEIARSGESGTRTVAITIDVDCDDPTVVAEIASLARLTHRDILNRTPHAFVLQHQRDFEVPEEPTLTTEGNQS